MGVMHDLICHGCGREYEGVLVEVGEYPHCKCGSKTTWKPAKLNTDLYGSPTYSDAADATFSSQSEKEKFMAKKGWHVAGDKVGGAREITKIKNTSFHYASQSSHISTGERSAARGGSR